MGHDRPMGLFGLFGDGRDGLSALDLRARGRERMDAGDWKGATGDLTAALQKGARRRRDAAPTGHHLPHAGQG